MINQLVAALGQELGLTSKEIADAVWLALQMEVPEFSSNTAEEATRNQTQKRSTDNRSFNRDPSTSSSDSGRDDFSKQSQSTDAELHASDAEAEGQGEFGSELTLNVPDARSLREPLSLAKSLKPLLKKVKAGVSTVLDDAATVERIADEGIWMPVLKPALEPWLDLALVVDESISMHLWQRTITELQRLLANYGVFRDVRVWSLVTDDSGQVGLRPRLGAAARRKLMHRPSELIDPSGRRLILIATDCVSAIWQDGTMLPALKLWASSGPMAIMQMLPEWLWARTGLGFASAVRLHSLMPGVPNNRLDIRDLSPWDEVDLDTGIRVPVVTLEPEPFLAWSKMLSAKGGSWSPGFVFDSSTATSLDSLHFQNSSLEDSAEQQVQRFRTTASPIARRLAGLLAAAPVISLPVVRIIRDRLLPKSRQIHVAEVFLGGLLRPLLELQSNANPGTIRYEFLEDVRGILLESIPTKDSLEVLDEVSSFVAARLGLSIDAFTAILRKPVKNDNQELVDQSRPFAIVTAKILHKLGGEYAQFAQQLSQSFQTEEDAIDFDKDKNFSSNFAQKKAVPLQAPPLPDHYVERPEHISILKSKILSENTEISRTLVVSAIYGLGGIGKSVLAATLAHDSQVQSHFSDGILWATLGQNPDILPLLSGWIQALGDHEYKPTAIESASNHLRTLLYDKYILLVVDDVWNPAHLDPFRVGGSGCCVLVTTREARISDAHRYDLDVMSADQALELMTQKLSGKLTEKNKQQAFAFADRVGYLPLALELAASQIEEGVTWSELLEDLQDEVARLETLDFYGREEIPDDAKRRKYSLLACFNLSLKQLSTKQLQQFAWLGVLPENVSLTQEIAETLWQVTARQAGFILRTFRAKGLVLQGVVQGNKRPSYRIHDLIHDLAQRLLISPSQPVQVGELPGLGLSRTAAHIKLLNRYKSKTRDRQWYTLKDDGYIYSYLTWHMEQAGRQDEIHQLLEEQTENGRNGWFTACDAIGRPSIFLNDLARARVLAKSMYDSNPEAAQKLEDYYSSLLQKLNNFTTSTPPKLMAEFVSRGIWSIEQALDYVSLLADSGSLSEAIQALAPYIPRSLLPKILEIIRSVPSGYLQAEIIANLASHFPELNSEALEEIRHIQDDFTQVQLLVKLTPHLPESFLPEALEAARQIQYKSARASALSALVPHMPESLPEALEVTRQIQNESARASALSALVPHMPESFLPEALEAARQIQDESARASALSALVPHMPESLPEALEVTRQIQNESARASALSALVPHMPESFLPEALEAARQIQDESARASALSALVPHMPESFLPEALEAARQIQDESARASALSALVPHMPESFLPEALEAARQIQYKSARASALSALVPHMPESFLPEALEAARQIQDESARASALNALAPHMPESFLPEALEAARQIQNDSVRASALSALASYLPESLLSEVLEATRQI